MAKTKVKKKPTFKQWLDDKKLSPEQFAVETDIHVSTVQKWLYIGSSPRDMHAKAIAEKYADCPLIA